MSKKSSRAPTRVQSGAATPAQVPEPVVDKSPVVVGLNFGQSYSSVAVINKEGLADCIANDDGERQVASAISFAGEQVYIGAPARQQLVRNQVNTVLAFRNLLGKSYADVKASKQPVNSAPIVDKDGQPAFEVEVDGKATVFTAHEIAVKYLTVLISYATDFLGRKVTGAVVALPTDFSDAQKEAVKKAVEDTGVKVWQTVSEAAAALTAYHATVELKPAEQQKLDQNKVVLDVGASSTSASVVAVREGLLVPLASVHDETVGGDLFDEKLMDWFGKEFTKKTKVPIEASNHRALMKLRLAVEITKKSLSASNTAPCSVESLAEGMDFHGSVNRMRFDLVSAAIYTKILDVVSSALAQANLDAVQIDEVILVGGTTKLPALTDKLGNLFTNEATAITGQLEPEEVISRGAALEGLALVKLYTDADKPEDLSRLASEFDAALANSAVVAPVSLSKPVGLVVSLPKNATEEQSQQAVDGKLFFTLADAQTPLPFRRIVDVPASSGANALVSLWEGESAIKEEKVTLEADSDDEEDEPQVEVTKTAYVKPTQRLVDLSVPVAGAKTVRLTLVVDAAGKGSVEAKAGGAAVNASF